MAQTVRFAELVKKSGRPHSVTLWSDPEQNSDFKRAIKENRILTVKQETVGSRKDFGTIGFHRGKNVSYFVFPRALPKTDSRIIGIKYDLLEKPEFKSYEATVKPAAKRKEKSQRVEPVEREFTATIRRTAVWETTLRISAKNDAEARKKTTREIGLQKFPESEALIHEEIRELREME